MFYRYFLPALTLILFQSCGSSQSSAGYLLDAGQFAREIEGKNIVLLDVRTPEEYAGGHLAHARNIDWNGTDFEKQAAGLPKSQPVYIYCLSGGRSHTAAEKLRQSGYTVYEMDGGIMQWRKAGLPEEKPSASAALSAGMSREDFQKLVSADAYVLVDFYAPWCGPCKKMKPALDEIEQEMNGALKIIRINTDANIQLAREMDISTIPYLQLYKKGELKWENTGYMDKKYIADTVHDFK